MYVLLREQKAPYRHVAVQYEDVVPVDVTLRLQVWFPATSTPRVKVATRVPTVTVPGVRVGVPFTSKGPWEGKEGPVRETDPRGKGPDDH